MSSTHAATRLPRPGSLPPARRPLGAWRVAGATHFALFSTAARRCEVRFFDPQTGGANGAANLPLDDAGQGYFTGQVADLDPGTLYKFVLDGRELPDPYARWLPFGVHGPAAVVTPGHRWRHAAVERHLRDHVIYELHVGTFTPEGTYQAARARLPHLAQLGITAIELMPLAAFAGERGWGYDGVALFAPFAPYGTPDQLRAFIDEAHGLGLAVFLDVVYNHFGPAGNYLAAYSPEYFTKQLQNGWGDAPNFAHPVMRQMVLDNALYWLRDFHFDGLRLDAIHAILDPSPRHILAELANEVRALGPGKILVGEDDRNQPGSVSQLGLSAVWADDFHHAVRVTLTGEQDGYYAAYPCRDGAGAEVIAETIREGWLYRGQINPCSGKPRGQGASELPAHAFVYCIQNHDQIGNRAQGDRLTDVVPLAAYQAASTLLLFLPMTPLLFMGQEWAARTPFQFFTDHEAQLGKLITEGRRREFQSFAAMNDPDTHGQIPDPQARDTFLRSRLDWEELVRPPHADVLALYRALLRLRREDDVLGHADRSALAAVAQGPVLVVRRWIDSAERILLVNLSAHPVPVSAFAGATGLSVEGRDVLLSTCDLAPGFISLPAWAAAILD